MVKRYRWVLAAVGILFLCGVFLGWVLLSSFSPKGAGTYIYVDRGDTPAVVFEKMQRVASPRQMLGVRLTAFLLGYGGHVRAGRYETGGGVSSLRLVRNLRNGRQSAVQLVIPVVHTVNDLAARLSGQLQADSATLVRTFTDAGTLESCGVDTFTVLTLFIPNTYEVYWDIKPLDLLKRMKKERDSYWDGKRSAEAEAMGLTPDEVYTLASVVEQETANEKERPMIAGMYLNRLRQGMKLQADPTVKFALKDFGLRRIMHAHLTTDSPYNTYLHEGLPKGPICIPSRNAIESVLHYTHHNYLYMCAKEDFSGTHNFAATYEEHMANARRYADALNKRGIR